jgi:hypothetical protein
MIELVGQAHREFAYGAQRTQLWLRPVHDVRVAMGRCSGSSAISGCRASDAHGSGCRAR